MVRLALETSLRFTIAVIVVPRAELQSNSLLRSLITRHHMSRYVPAYTLRHKHRNVSTTAGTFSHRHPRWAASHLSHSPNRSPRFRCDSATCAPSVLSFYSSVRRLHSTDVPRASPALSIPLLCRVRRLGSIATRPPPCASNVFGNPSDCLVLHCLLINLVYH